jgi:hypothetical protein
MVTQFDHDLDPVSTMTIFTAIQWVIPWLSRIKAPAEIQENKVIKETKHQKVYISYASMRSSRLMQIRDLCSIFCGLQR